MANGVIPVQEPGFQLFYGATDITRDASPFVESLTYSDYLSGQSDELEVEMDDTDGRWSGSWYPTKGDVLRLRIGYAGGALLPAGEFTIDELGVSGPPSVVRVRALSAGVKRPVRTRKGRAYENTTLARIVGEVAKRNKLTVVGEIKAVPIDRVTQYRERDVEFLHRLARQYGYALKLKGQQLVFTALSALRDAAVVRALTPKDCARYELRDKIMEVYADAKVRYHDPAAAAVVSHDASDSAPASADTLVVAARAPTPESAQVQAEAALGQANDDRTTGSLTLRGDPRLVAGVAVVLVGFGKLSGTYLVTVAKHALSRGGGYSTDIDVRRTKEGV